VTTRLTDLATFEGVEKILEINENLILCLNGFNNNSSDRISFLPRCIRSSNWDYTLRLIFFLFSLTFSSQWILYWGNRAIGQSNAGTSNLWSALDEYTTRVLMFYHEITFGKIEQFNSVHTFKIFESIIYWSVKIILKGLTTELKG